MLGLCRLVNLLGITCRNPSGDTRQGGKLVSSCVWDPFQSVTHIMVSNKYYASGQSRGTLTGLIVRDPNMEDGVGGANRPGHVRACPGRGDKTTVTPVDMVVHIL